MDKEKNTQLPAENQPVENKEGPHREAIPPEKIDGDTGRNLDPQDDGDGEDG